MQKSFLFVLIVTTTALVAVSGQTGGSLYLSRSVIASGGGTSSGGGFRIDGTVGESIAGTTSSGGPFSVYGGFWTPAQLAPTAASVSVSGRVLSAEGRAIRRASVTLIGSDGSQQIAYTGTFGSYKFENVEAGASYVVTVSDRRHSFASPSIVIHVVDQIADANFIAQPRR